MFSEYANMDWSTKTNWPFLDWLLDETTETLSQTIYLS